MKGIGAEVLGFILHAYSENKYSETRMIVSSQNSKVLYLGFERRPLGHNAVALPLVHPPLHCQTVIVLVDSALDLDSSRSYTLRFSLELNIGQ